MNSRKTKILVLFFLIILGFAIFLLVVFYRANIERKLPKLETNDVNTALRGNIVTKDGFSVAVSQKLYKVMVNTNNYHYSSYDKHNEHPRSCYSKMCNEDTREIYQPTCCSYFCNVVESSLPSNPASLLFI